MIVVWSVQVVALGVVGSNAPALPEERDVAVAVDAGIETMRAGATTLQLVEATGTGLSKAHTIQYNTIVVQDKHMYFALLGQRCHFIYKLTLKQLNTPTNLISFSFFIRVWNWTGVDKFHSHPHTLKVKLQNPDFGSFEQYTGILFSRELIFILSLLFRHCLATILYYHIYAFKIV